MSAPLTEMATTDELMLLERVFLRFGSAETDEQLQNAINRFLPPVLLKLSSQQDGVRKKVMELLVHINKRIKSRPCIQLPIDTLLLQYQDPTATSFLVNFTIIYIKLGYPRLGIERQAELVPSIINCLNGKPRQHQDSLLYLIMPVLTHLKIPQDPLKKKQLLSGVNEKSEIVQYFLEFMMDMLLLPYGSVTGQSSNSTSENGGNLAAPPGMSEYGFKRVTAENPLDAAGLENAKLGIVKFLSSGIFDNYLVMPLLVIGSSDTRHSVANSAEMELHRTASNADWNVTSVVTKLFSIFLGTVSVKNQKVTVSSEYKRQPVSTRIRLKIFPQLLKSRESCIHFPACIQVVFSCLYGEQVHAKLRLLAAQFVHHVCNYCPNEKFKPIAGVLLSAMVQLIDSEDKKLKTLAFVAIGKIGQKVPLLISSDMIIIQRLFNILSQEEMDVKMAVQEALYLLMKAFDKKLSLDNTKMMEAIVMENIDKPDAQTRLAAVQYASAIFPSTHILSRYCLLLASGDSKEEVSAEALRALGLVQSGEKSNNKSNDAANTLPSFSDVVDFISSKASERLKKPSLAYSVGNRVLPFHPAIYVNVLSYLRLCLSAEAGIVSSNEHSHNVPKMGKHLRNLYQKSKSEDDNPVYKYLNLVSGLLTATKDVNAMKYLSEGIAGAPDLLASQFSSQIELIKSCMCSTKEEMRESSAVLLAFVASYSMEKKNINDLISELVGYVKNKPLEGQHGSLLALGHLVSRLYRLQKDKIDSIYDHNVVEEAVKFLVEYLNDTSAVIINACCVSLGEIGRNGPLPLPDGDDDKPTEISKRNFIKKLLDMLITSKTSNKTKERAAVAVGHFCVGDPNPKLVKMVIDGLLESAKETQGIDIPMTVGESLACAVLGPHSASARDTWLMDEEEFATTIETCTSPHSGVLGDLLDEILAKYANHTKLSIRQSACIWLLILLNRCRKSEELITRLVQIQNAMLSLLGDRSDIIQEFASKSLALVYEYGDEQQKQSLVTILVDTLTKGRKANRGVTGDTEVFQEGSLGTDMSGGNLSTYKDLCSLATDLNQPDLVYKFMHLANHNAIWNSKKGAAFGFGSIAEQAGEKLSEHLPRIVPKLYRYTFDPNPKARLSFGSIWKSLVPESQKAIDAYLKEIMEDLLDNLTSDQWRVRESCCMAVCDLLRGRSMEQLLDYLPQLWQTCFRVRDDIKESVRNAADSTLKTLSKVSIKFCDVNNGSQNAINIILPCLIKTGLVSPVQDVRMISLKTVTELSRSAGKLLRPHLPLLFVALLESLSTEESAVLNMMSVRLGSHQDSQQQLDTLRIASSRTSPMMDTINYCIQFVDSSVISEIVSRLIDLLKHSPGLATKAGSAHVVVSLVHQCPTELSTHAGKIMAALLNGLVDRNAAVRNCYATTLGNLIKCAKDSSVDKLLARLQKWYFDENNQVIQESCGSSLQAMIRYSPDVIKSHAVGCLPLAFFAMHNKDTSDQKDKKVNVWEEVWNEMTPGTEAGVRIYLTEIIQIVCIGLDSQSWQMKGQAGRAVSTVAMKLASNMTSGNFNQIMTALLAALSGRTWTGKETLLHATASLAVKCKDTWNEYEKENRVTKSQVVESLLRECGKDNAAYKREALMATSDVLDGLDIDKFEIVYDVVKPIVSKDENEDDDDEKENVSKLRLVCFEVVGKVWPETKETQDKFQEEICELLCANLRRTTWKMQLVIMASMNNLVKRLKLFEDGGNNAGDDSVREKLVNLLVPSLCYCTGNIKYSSIRSESLKVLRELCGRLNKLRTNPLKSKSQASNLETLTASLSTLMKDNQPDISSRATELKNILAKNF